VKPHITELASDELMALVRGGTLDDFQILDVLRSPYCTSQIAEILATSRENLGSQSIREKLAGFPGLSNAQAMNLIGTLSWAALIALAQTPKTPALVRRQAERKLILQVPTMSLGEKIAMARRAHRALFPALITGCDDQILAALLDNPRLVENDLVVLINTGNPPVEFISVVARHHRWGKCYGLRKAIVECPHSPLPLALSVLVQLPKSDQKRIADRDNIPARVRSAAAALCVRGQSDERSQPASS